MVRTEDLVPDDVVSDIGVHESLGDDKVIQSPAHVLSPAVHHVRPEGVGLLFVGVEMAERVDQVILGEEQLKT